MLEIQNGGVPISQDWLVLLKQRVDDWTLDIYYGKYPQVIFMGKILFSMRRLEFSSEIEIF